MEVKLVREILEANDLVARSIRQKLESNRVLMINIMGSPGSGKTTLLESTIERLGGTCRIGVIEGDICTSIDAEKLAKHRIPVVQINTEPFGGECHLSAPAVGRAIESIDLSSLDLLFIENVGNLVCPAEFAVGEHAKVVVLSLPEGDDKPLKYPLMFRESRVMVVSKLDLLPHIDADLEKLRANALLVNPSLEIFPLSAKNGVGLEDWIAWVTKERNCGR
jgi:hydrogenase nickel incorporation protein HypB